MWIDSSGNMYVGDMASGDQVASAQEEAAHHSPRLIDYDIAIERHLDAEAESAGYYDPLQRIPNIDRACSYAGYENQYQAESQSFVAWRAAVWAYAYQVKSEVEAGTREQPTIEAMLAELPVRVVP
jgi:hypothetical protein